MVLDAAGNLYGATQLGGAFGNGAVFKIDPSGNETLLHSFDPSNGDGEWPYSGVIADRKGNLYGTTWYGGANYTGIVFQINTAGTETILYNFGSNPNDGYLSWGDLAIDAKGNIYGTTMAGGTNGLGAIFKVTSAGTETVVYSFGPPPMQRT
jgi:uncharacterized repeat protein (TIGR03803 family)